MRSALPDHRSAKPPHRGLPIYPAAISLAGDYVFVSSMRTMNTLVYRADTLALVGRIDIGQQAHTPLIDGPAEMIARKRSKTDEYVLFFPMYVGNATTVVDWKPSDKNWLASPAQVRVAAGTITWDTVPSATGYAIERQDLTSTGWGIWQTAGQTKEATFSETKAPDTAGHAWRERALGPTPSDWSFSIFQRR